MATEVWDRFTVHYTPTHGSWLNQAEIEIGLFSRQCLGTRRIPDLKALRRESRAWNRRMNRDRIKINWTFDRKAARRKFGYKSTLSSGHRPSSPISDFFNQALTGRLPAVSFVDPAFSSPF